MNTLEFLKANISEIDKMQNVLNKYLDTFDALEKYRRFNNREEMIVEGYREAWEVLTHLSRDINLYLKDNKESNND